MSVPRNKSNLSQKKWFWQNNRRQRVRTSVPRKHSMNVSSSYVSLTASPPRKYVKSTESLSGGYPQVSKNIPSRPIKVNLPVNLPKSSSRRFNRNSESKEVSKKHRIPIMPASDAFPMWLQHMQKVQRYSSIAVFLLVLSNLTVYGWTVYAQQLWSQNSRNLQRLQRQERQLTTHNETIKNKMAIEAQKPTAGLVSPTPSGTLFLNRPKNNLPKSPINESSEKTESDNLEALSY
ncbi:MAG: hypothetical protein AAF208_06095 [Cyanobacteria bacterium P01_A01_bin.45]